MTYREFLATKPIGVSEEAHLRSLPDQDLISLAIDMRANRFSDEYQHILNILDALVPKYEIQKGNV